ncbi:glycosyltransferase family 2 protein [Methylomonas sp. MgM2]
MLSPDKAFKRPVSVTVVIVNWNSGDALSKCLDHMSKQSVAPHGILVMDNGSGDESLSAVADHSRVEVHLLGANLGFAAANNLALSKCDTDYVALLNPDAFPDPDWLERLLSAADRHPECAAFASLQLCDDNPKLIDGTGDRYHISGLVWRDRYGAPLNLTAQENEIVFSPCAAAALYRREAMADVGGFDEDYFCYVEDVDLGFRLRLAGHKAMYVHDAVVRHMGSASTGGQHSDFCVYHGHRNLVWTYFKNMPGLLFWALLPLHLLLNAITVVYFTFKGQRNVIWQAKLDAVKGIPKMWRKRRQIQKKRTATFIEIWRCLDKRIWLSRR